MFHWLNYLTLSRTIIITSIFVIIITFVVMDYQYYSPPQCILIIVTIFSFVLSIISIIWAPSIFYLCLLFTPKSLNKSCDIKSKPYLSCSSFHFCFELIRWRSLALPLPGWSSGGRWVCWEVIPWRALTMAATRESTRFVRLCEKAHWQPKEALFLSGLVDTCESNSE